MECRRFYEQGTAPAEIIERARAKARGYYKMTLFSFSNRLEALRRDRITVYIDVWNKEASLAFARLSDKKGEVEMIHITEENLDAWGLEYRDLIDAVEEIGAIDVSGRYPVTDMIVRALDGREAQASALFNKVGNRHAS